MFESASFTLARIEAFLFVFANLIGLKDNVLLFPFAFLWLLERLSFKIFYKLIRYVFILLRIVFCFWFIFFHWSFSGVFFSYCLLICKSSLYRTEFQNLEVIGRMHTFFLVFHTFYSFFLRSWLFGFLIGLWFRGKQKKLNFFFKKIVVKYIMIFLMAKFKNVDLRLSPISVDYSLVLLSLP